VLQNRTSLKTRDIGIDWVLTVDILAGSILPALGFPVSTYLYERPIMHFRLRSNVIQIVRTTYDAAAKKPRTEIVGACA